MKLTSNEKKEADQLQLQLSRVIKAKRSYKLEELYTLMDNHLVGQFGKMLLEDKERLLFNLNAREGLRSVLVRSAIDGVAFEVHPIGKGIHISQTFDRERVNALNGVLSEKEKLTAGEVAGGAAGFIAHLAAEEAKGAAMGCLGAIPGFNIIVNIMQASKMTERKRKFHLATKDNVPLITALHDELKKLVEV